MTDEVEVEQVDREARAKVLRFLTEHLGPERKNPREAPNYEENERQLDLIFARHRLASRPAPAEDAVGVIEKAAKLVEARAVAWRATIPGSTVRRAMAAENIATDFSETAHAIRALSEKRS